MGQQALGVLPEVTALALGEQQGGVAGRGSAGKDPDVAENVLCLCPNHHVQFDKGALALTDELDLLGFDGEFRVDPQHGIDLDYVRYHRESLYLSGKS